MQSTEDRGLEGRGLRDLEQREGVEKRAEATHGQ
jgi:hypothetical protein